MSTPSTASAGTVAATVATPDGPFTVLAGEGAVLASGWTDDVASLRALVHRTLLAAPGTTPGTGGATSAGVAGGLPGEAPGTVAGAVPDDGEPGVVVGDAEPGVVLAAALDAVAAYYDGDLAAPRRLPVRQCSGAFRQHAWDVLRGVGPGERVTYTEYALRAGRPTAVRAAAGACAMNAAALFVPCHRVLRTDGTLGGFRYGVAIKERLLAREAPGGVAHA